MATTLRPSTRRATALALAAAMAGVPAALPAQVVRAAQDPAVAAGTATLVGTVVDAAGQPLLGAEAVVGERRRALTDAEGVFTLRDVPAGTVHLWVRRIGHRPVSFDVAAVAGTRVELRVQLAPSPVRLGEVIVEGKAYDRALWDVGFYERERVARGRFLDPDLMATFGGAGVSTLLRDTPRLMIERKGNEYYAYGPIAGGRCPLHVFVDGKYAREAMPGPRGAPGIPLDQVVPRDDIHAIEVYPTFTSVPAEFTRIGPGAGQQGVKADRIPSPPGRPGMRSAPPPRVDVDNADAACGAIVLWTKTFTAEKR